MAGRIELSEQKLGYIRELVNDNDPKEEYKLIQSIGTGTYGEVYKALRLRTKELAAVKIIKIDAKDDILAILQEIQTLRECRHSNIVQYFGSYFRNNKLWICMEFCGGFSMQDIYTNIRRPIDEKCIAFVTGETLRGIEYMHRAGRIHRDIKGANILLTNDGEVKIADFGVAARITQTIQRRNSFIGTPYWMAPEVAAVERKGGYDEKCDIWALGITAIEYAELQPPLFDLHPMRALQILGTRSYKPPTLRNKSAWSTKFHSFLKSCLTKNEKKRPNAQTLSKHEFVTQPHLTRSLTLKLLDLNRNPDGPTCPANSVALASPSFAAVNPSPVTVVQENTQASNARVTAIMVGVSEAKSASNSFSTSEESKRSSGEKRETCKKRKLSIISKRPQPPEKMHIPWFVRAASNDSTPTGSTPTTPLTAENSLKSAGVLTDLKEPAEHISPVRQANGILSDFIKANASNNAPKSLLEAIRIMDELPKPLPAYVSDAPTASPAVKPSGEFTNPSCFVRPSTTVSPASPPGLQQATPLEAKVKRSHISSSGVIHTSTNPLTSDSLVIQPSKSTSSCSTSSCSSASTSPRSSCSSLTMESIHQAELRHNSTRISVQQSSVANVDHSPSQTAVSSASEHSPNQCNGSAIPPVRAQTIVSNVASPVSTQKSSSDHVTVFEQVILQDSLEAQFIPIDTSAFVLSPDSVQTEASERTRTEQHSMSPLESQTSPSAIDVNVSPSATLDRSSSSSSEDNDEEHFEHYFDSDEDHEGGGCEFGGDDVSRNSFVTHGTVTTVDSDSSSANISVCAGASPCSTAVIPDLLTQGPQSTSPESYHEKLRSSSHVMTAPVAAMENPDDWDLSVAGDELLAADGLLHMTQSRPDSISDRISEFGFHIHGSSDGEEEDDLEDDDFVDDEQNDVVIPHTMVDLNGPFSQGSPFSNQMAHIPNEGSAFHARPVGPLTPSDHRISNGLNPPELPNGVSASNKPVLKTHPCENSPVEGLLQTYSLVELHRDKSGEELMSVLRQLKFAQKFAWLSGVSVPTSALAALCTLQTSVLSLNGSAEPSRHELLQPPQPPSSTPGGQGIRSDFVSVNSVDSSHYPSVSPGRDGIVTHSQVTSSPVSYSTPSILSSTAPAFGTESIDEPVALPISVARDRPLVFPTVISEGVLYEDVLPMDPDFSFESVPIIHSILSVSLAHSVESGIQVLTSPSDVRPSSVVKPLATALSSDDTFRHSVNELPIQSQGPVVSPPNSPCVTEGTIHPTKLRTNKYLSRSLSPLRIEIKLTVKTRSWQCFASPTPLTAPTSDFANPHLEVKCETRPSSRSSTFNLQADKSSPDGFVNLKRRNSMSQPSSGAPISIERAPTAEPLTPFTKLRDQSRSQPLPFSPGWENPRFSMVELTHMDEKPFHDGSYSIASTPFANAGACFSLIFEGCPLKLNATASWTNPATNGQILLFGTNDGIYYLNLKDRTERSLELLFPRRCLWLSVVRDTMMSLSGRHPQLYSHDLVSLMKLKSQGHAMSSNPSKLGKLTKLFPKRFSPSKKIPDTKGCQRVSVTRSPFNGAKYLCAAIGNTILVMEWFNPVSSFIEIKRTVVPDMPSPLLTFDLLIVKDRPLPLVCLGVYRHHSKRGRARQRYRLHLIDLNAPNPPIALDSATGSSFDPSGMNKSAPMVESAPHLIEEQSRKIELRAEYHRRNTSYLPEDILPVVEVVQLEHNTILVCFQDCAKVIGLSGRIKSSRHRATTFEFEGTVAESIVCLRDSILVFHPHGLLGRSFTGELTQDIHDARHIYRLLGCDRKIVVETRPADDPMSNSNVYLLSSYTDSLVQ
ncbi:unnamed protein product [Dicrocoelium dendriticum]|nr:unnamed protein product [Dicrocoelium dendriticum]